MVHLQKIGLGAESRPSRGPGRSSGRRGAIVISRQKRRAAHRSALGLTVVAMLMGTLVIPAEAAPGTVKPPQPSFTEAAAFDTSAPLSTLVHSRASDPSQARLRPDRGPIVADTGFTGDGAVQASQAKRASAAASTVSAPLASFEGLSSQNNFHQYGFRVNPPDPIGDVGPNQYVEMTNLLFAVYSKTGATLLGPAPYGNLWAGFAVDDCTDPSGDPVVVYDQLADRWILSQFTTRGLDDPTLPFYNCVAVSTTGDATGTYYRYAFSTGFNFPDYPKYGVWTDSYVITTREFGPTVEYGIGVYGLEKNKMLNGQPARAVRYFLDGNDPAILPLVGDGLLPADIDGKQKPKTDTAIPLVGTQDDGGPYGAASDAANIWDFMVKWRSTPISSLALRAQLPVAAFDSIFPCGAVAGSRPPSARDCLPQPGVTDGSQYLDILSYRQRPTWRLAYRNFKGYESLVTSQSVEAAPGVAGVRWYEFRRSTSGTYSVYQQGTYAPGDGVHRWMGSIAQDRSGNMALGYSVVNATNVYPGIRYTGRLAGDPAGEMTLGEGVAIAGSGVQTTTNSRWGDYTSMNVDPVDDCTFWYVNEYYTAAGQASAPNGWQTRISSFKLPGC